MRWYHTIELPGGVVTPGEYDLRPIVARLPWPPLQGKRCLDIGSRDGFYAFEMKRRGASEVVSVDIEDPAELDFPGRRPDDELIQSELEAGNRAFEIAREALGSSVERRYLSVYTVDRAELGPFDFAVIGTLLHHLRDPVRALVATRTVVRGQLLINDAVVPGLASLRHKPVAELLMRDGPFWWLCNPAGLRRLAEAAGFEILDWSRPYVIGYGRGGRPPSLRSCLRRPVGEVAARLLLRRGVTHAWVLARPAG